MGYYAAVDAVGYSGFGFGNATYPPLVDIQIDGASIGPTYPYPGSIGSLFEEVSGTYTTGPTQTSLDVLFEASASGTWTVGLSLDDFFFVGPAPSPVPGPVVGAGLPGLIAACGGLSHGGEGAGRQPEHTPSWAVARAGIIPPFLLVAVSLPESGWGHQLNCPG